MRYLYRLIALLGLAAALLSGSAIAASATPAPSGSAAPSSSPSASSSPKPSLSVKPSASTSSSPKCDTVHYRTAGKDCVPFGEKKFGCKDLVYQVHVVVPGKDPKGLDKDKNGIGCEANLPWPTPTAAPSTSSAVIGGSSLPNTGSRTGIAVAVGTAAVVGGAALLLARRRRVRFTA